MTINQRNGVVFFCYHRRDDNVLETSLKSLRSVSDCRIVIASDGVTQAFQEHCEKTYGVRWDIVPPEQMTNRRATCKMERLLALVNSFPDGAQVLVADADTYFLRDPFEPFSDHQMDVGLTARGYEHWAPINGGIFYLRIGPSVQRWMTCCVNEILDPRWQPFVDWRQRWGHETNGFDWWVDQDFLNACWGHHGEIESRFGIHLVDVGPAYNFCPTVEADPAAKETVLRAYREKSVAVLHLKSDLKDLIYAGVFEHAVTHHEKGGTCWL